MSIIKNLKFKKVDGFDATEFAKILEQAYSDTARDGKGTKKTTFSPSTVGFGHGTCPRYWFIAFNGADFDETKDAAAIANMLNGTYSHERIQKLLEGNPVLVEIEREMKYDDPPIRGFADLIVDWDGKEVIGEIKTIKDENFAIKQASNKPTGSHLVQVLIYMKINDSDTGFVMYENKNTQEICVIPISMNESNEEFIDSVFDWMRSVYSLYKEGSLPARGYTKSSYQCKFCPVKKTCWKEMEDGEDLLGNLAVPK